MGEYARRLHRHLTSKAHQLPTQEPKRRPGELLPGGIKDVATLIKEGLDPIHAAYVFMQNFTSHFAEGVSHFPEMKNWAAVVAKAEDEYLPSGPPMSPLTGSYFWMWAIYDLRIGKSTDTVAYCQIAMNDVLQMNAHQLDAAKKLEQSRMGIYEQIGMDGPHIRLAGTDYGRQLPRPLPGRISSARKVDYGTSGSLPPLEPQLAEYWIAMTTPYILMGASQGGLDRLPEADDGPLRWPQRSHPAPQPAQARAGAELLERVRLQGVSPPSTGCGLSDGYSGH